MIDIMKICTPPIHDTKNVDKFNIEETGQQHFSAISNIQPAFNEYKTYVHKDS